MEDEKDTAATHAQLKLRLPRALREQLKARAKSNIRTMNSEAIYLLSAALGADKDTHHAKAPA